MTRRSSDDASNRPAGSRDPTAHRRAPTDRSDSGPETSRRAFLAAAGASVGALSLGPAASADVDDATVPQLYVDGNRIVDATGAEVPLRGVTVPDPREISLTARARGKNTGQVLDLITDADRGWHPTVVRVTVRPTHVGEHGPRADGGAPEPVAFTQNQLLTYLDSHLDPVVDRLASAGVYCVLDYHRDDAATATDWRDPGVAQEVRLFWETVASWYGHRRNVLYEVYGRPGQPGIPGDPTVDDDLGDVWRTWKATVQPWVDLIRQQAPDTVVIVGSPGRNRSPDGALVEPFDGYDLAYAYHSRPGDVVSGGERWDESGLVGDGTNGVAAEVPLFVTDVGWRNAATSSSDEIDDRVRGTTSGYGEPFVEWMESSPGVYWTASVADVAHPLRAFAPSFDALDRERYGEIDPYDGTVPRLCRELPCEWDLLGHDRGEYDDFAGAFVRDTLAELQGDVDLAAPSTTSPLAPPRVLEFTERSPTSVSFYWRVDADGDRYHVTVDGEEHTVTDSAPITIDGLEPDTEYRLAIRSLGAGGDRVSRPYVETIRTRSESAGPPAAPADAWFAPGDDEWLRVAWTPVEAADRYVARVGGEPIARTTGTSIDVSSEFLEPYVELSVAAENAYGTGSPRQAGEYVPPEERRDDVSTTASTRSLYAGEEATVSFALNSVSEFHTGFEGEVAVATSDPAAVITDVAPNASFASASVESIPEGGASSVGVSLEGTPAEPGAFDVELLTVTVEGVDGGDATVGGSLAARYADTDEPDQVAVADASIAVSRPTSVPAPAHVEDVDATATSVDVEWSRVEDAASYVVWAADHEPPMGPSHSVTLLGDPPWREPGARTAETAATIEGLDPGHTYEIGVASVDAEGGQSPPDVILARTAPAPDAPDRPTMALDLAEGQLTPDEHTTATLTLSEAPNGILGIAGEVRLDDASVATITDVSFADVFSYTDVKREGEDGSWITFDAMELTPLIGPGATDVDVLTIELEATEPGATEVDLALEQVTQPPDGTLEVRPEGDRLDVEVDWTGTLAAVDESDQPRDLDHDGLYRDVDGDGAVGQGDVAEFFGKQHREDWKRPAAFDFSGNGAVSHGDVVELADYVATE